MNPIPRPKLLAGLGLIAAVVVAALLTTLAITGGSSGEPGAPPGELKKGLERIEEEEAKPGFAGDKSGIFIDGTHEGASVPGQYTTADEICPPGAPNTLASWEEAGKLAFDVALPAEYEYLPDDPDTGPVACDGTVYVAKRAYGHVPRGHVIIGRSVTNVISGMHWPVDRVKVVTIAGKEVVLLEPIFPEWNEAGGTQTQIVIPEPFGMTFVFTSGVDLVDVISLAELVIKETKS
jgi:hypothetical protein